MHARTFCMREKDTEIPHCLCHFRLLVVLRLILFFVLTRVTHTEKLIPLRCGFCIWGSFRGVLLFLSRSFSFSSISFRSRGMLTIGPDTSNFGLLLGRLFVCGLSFEMEHIIPTFEYLFTRSGAFGKRRMSMKGGGGLVMVRDFEAAAGFLPKCF